jgi:Cdc6-like AAA superfamily ATPase
MYYMICLQETFDMVVSGAGFAMSLTPAIRQGLKALSPNSTAIAVDILNASTIARRTALQGGLLVRRECFAEYSGAVELARDDEQNPCLLVYGPRGVGKTSLVQAAMQVSPK